MIPLKDIQQAAERIAGRVIKTPLLPSPTLSRMFGGQMYLKLENLQKTGAFKVRGAAYKLLKCRERIGSKGVVAASAGNHAQGVALAAREVGVPAVIVMPEWVSISKEQATRKLGAEVVIAGRSVGESLAIAQRLADDGRLFIHPFDDEDIITGQGTAGLEILADLEDPDLIVVPVGGGGLISGITSALKGMRPETQVVGIQTSGCPSAYESLLKNTITAVNGKSSIADGISVKKIGRLTFDIIREDVDEIILVEEEQIAAAVLLLLEKEKILAEGSGAAPLAAVMSATLKVPKGGKTVLVISGGNVDSPLLGRIISQGLIKNGRILRIQIHMADVPGSLAQLLELIAALKANVLHIYHDRNIRELPLYVTQVELELETRGPEHVREIERALIRSGYEFTIK